VYVPRIDRRFVLGVNNCAGKISQKLAIASVTQKESWTMRMDKTWVTVITFALVAWLAGLWLILRVSF